MTDEAKELWERALQARRSAARNLGEDPDLAASRSYYAVFYAVAAQRRNELRRPSLSDLGGTDGVADF